jgi:hypothetical protein
VISAGESRNRLLHQAGDYAAFNSTAPGPPVNILFRDLQIQILACLTEGMSIRSTERITGVHRDAGGPKEKPRRYARGSSVQGGSIPEGTNVLVCPKECPNLDSTGTEGTGPFPT